MPFLVELGVLLDLFVGVFVMGIIVHHVSRQLPTAGADPLRALKE
jgi:hydrogenase-4 component E